MSVFLFIFLLVAAGYGAWAVALLLIHRSERKMVREFRRKFPGRCMVCSFWRYSVLNGCDDAPEPPPHDFCPEGHVSRLRDSSRTVAGHR